MTQSSPVDTGMCNVWGARYITPNGKREQWGSFRHGTMANALPQAIGAQVTDRNRQVVSFCCDGGLTMLLGELITVKQHNLPVKMFVFNNSSQRQLASSRFVLKTYVANLRNIPRP